MQHGWGLLSLSLSQSPKYYTNVIAGFQSICSAKGFFQRRAKCTLDEKKISGVIAREIWVHILTTI